MRPQGTITLPPYWAPAATRRSGRSRWGQPFLPKPGVAAGNNNSELFQPRGDISRNLLGGQYFSGSQTVTITGNGSETCSTYNLMKLARNLFFHDPDPSYMDYLERGLVNHILGSRLDTTSGNSPQVTYFLPVSSGGNRGYGNTGTCCGGTGMENHTKYQESVYFRSADGSVLWVNLFIASTLSWPERGFTVVQTTDFPRGQSSRLVINGSGPLTLKLRVARLDNQGVRGQRQRRRSKSERGSGQLPDPAPGLEPRGHGGDHAAVPAAGRAGAGQFIDPVAVPRPGAADPAGRGDRQPAGAPVPPALVLPASQAGRGPGTGGHPGALPNHYTMGTTTLRPLYVADTQAYHTYFRRDEPSVVFGVISSGVPNDGIRDDDGLTVLDRIGEKAPFANHGMFVQRVEEVTAAWLEAGRHTRGQRQAILTSAARANQELEP